MTYSAINIQGNILSSEILEKIRTEDIRFQNAKDFNLDPRTSVRDEISLAWSLALSHWKAFQLKREKLSSTDTGTTDTRNYWMKPLMSILGYDLSSANADIINGKTYAISFRASNLDNFPVHIVGINQSLDARAETGGPRLSPHALVQEYLNNQEHMYALVGNGKFLRLLRDATRLSRLSYIEFNLEQMMEESLYAEFALLFRVLHASRMPQKIDAGVESILEFYHQEALASGSRIRERLSLAVETSIKELANGFLLHKENEDLRDAIAKSQVNAKDYYLYNLRIIYRLLFLMVIEERKLIFPLTRDKMTEQRREIYYNYYSVQRLCGLVEKMVYVDPKKTDLWQSLKTCFALFEQGKYGTKLAIAPLGSGLFAHDSLGMLSDQALDNGAFLKVLQHLVTFENEVGQRVRVNYADLDVEEFGSVYEGLLEYEPQLLEPATHPVFIFKEGKERSKSGSHYTPEELVKPLIKHSLDYLIEDKLKEKNPESALLSLKVCDVACGSGHILLSAARRIGFELAKLRSKEDQPSPTVLRQAIRDVINHCIYGVDKNPLAVELCKVAMWLEAHNPGQPLNFLDHRIKCGDAIVGLAHRSELENGIANEAFKTLPGDEKDIAKSFRDRNVKERKERAAKASQLKAEFEKTTESSVQEAMSEYKTFNQLPETTPEEIERKARAYKRFFDVKGFVFLKAMADTQVAQFFIAKNAANKDFLMTDADFRLILSGYKGWQDRKISKATVVALEQRFFHWFMEFPEVFQDGGFDCILGNPPFLGGLKISTHNGHNFLNWIHTYFSNSKGTTDLVAYFFRRIYSILENGGIQSLISTNTIAQGDTRIGGLQEILNQGGSIIHAVRSTKWPGLAAVQISLVSIVKAKWQQPVNLNGKTVKEITSYLDESSGLGQPYQLKQNKDQCYIGTYVFGEGFVLTEEQKTSLIEINAKNEEVISPYINGQELNSDFMQRAGRWVINFGNMTEDVAREYYEPFNRIETLVKPERIRCSDARAKKYWWQFARNTIELYEKLNKERRGIVAAIVSKTHAFSFADSNKVFSKNIVILPYNRIDKFAILQSVVHEEWAWKYSSTMKSDRNYSPSDCFETFPFPQVTTSEQISKLSEIGESYHENRKQLMLHLQLGLTKTYNLYHRRNLTSDNTSKKNRILHELSEKVQQEILRQRELHVLMDKVVLETYSWQDIQLRHDFYEVDYLPENDRVRFTIHPEARKEILKRLLELNHKIHEEELKKGLWDKNGKKTKKGYETSGETNILEELDESLGGLFKQE
jgi:methylase of polypeptide subunit release factors